MRARASLRGALFHACSPCHDFLKAPTFLLMKAPENPSCSHEVLAHACPDASSPPGVALDPEVVVPSCLLKAVLKTSGLSEDPACPSALVPCREAPYSCEVQGGAEVRGDLDVPSYPVEEGPGETKVLEVPFDSEKYRGRACHLDPSEVPC